MSFDTSQMTYGHLVTYPSVWLPPANTVKILLLAHSQQQASDYVQKVQDVYPQIDWAFYLVDDPSALTKEHVDWLWINHFHMHAVVAHATDSFSIAMLVSMKDCDRYALAGDNPVMNSLVEFAGIHLWTDSQEMFAHMVDQFIEQKVVGDRV